MICIRRLLGVLFVIETLIPAVYLAIVFGGGLFGLSTYVIESGSMEPVIKTGSLVYVERDVDAKSIAPGEVIAFKIDGASADVCTHRIVSNDVESRTIRTKGDSNKEIDATPIPYSSIIGRVVFSIPYLGFVAYLVTDLRAYIFLSYVIVLIATFAAHRFVIEQETKDIRSRRMNTYGIKRYC